jgi:alpha-glucosidase
MHHSSYVCKAAAIAAAFLLFASTAIGQWHSIGSIDEVLNTTVEGVTFRSGAALVQVLIIGDGIARIRFKPGKDFDTDHSWAVIRQPEPVNVRISESPEAITLASSHLSILIKKNPVRLTFLDGTGAVIAADDSLNGMSWSGDQVRVWKKRPIDECYYGFGEKAGKLERTETHMTMWNSDIPAYGADTDPLYQDIPFFYGIRRGTAYGIFFDNSARASFDMGKESRNSYSFGAETGELNYYFYAGPKPKNVLSAFTEMVGRMPLPPLWSLGYQQSRWSYKPDTRVREIARGFRSRNIPCDVLYFDIDYMDGYRIFTWSPKNFPNPKGLLDELKNEGFNIAVIVDPGIKTDTAYASYRSGLAANSFVKYPDGRVFTGKVWPGVCAFPDFTSSEARLWWGKEFKSLTDAGVRGFWNDMNEPSVFDVPAKTIDLDVLHNGDGLGSDHARSHNIYGMQMTRATYDGTRALLKGERPFILTRASYAGGWRYSAAWTGDNVSSWEHLELALSMCMNLSISGQPFVGTDIGGFMGRPSGELFARWLQAGVFTPLMRAHSHADDPNKEPWEFGDTFTAVNRSTIELRYRFLPFIYNEMRVASVTGIPPMRPMMFDYPENQWNHNRQDQFLFGDNLVVAPVIQPGQTKRTVALPPGQWYDFWTDTLAGGDRYAPVEAPLDRLPLFVRAGSVIPMRNVVQHADGSPIDTLTLAVYAGIAGQTHTSEYYEDDGHSFDYEKGVSLQRTITQKSTADGLEITMSAVSGSYRPKERQLALRIAGLKQPPIKITVTGKDAEGKKSPTTTSVQVSYDRVRNVATVVTKDRWEDFEIKIANSR